MNRPQIGLVGCFQNGKSTLLNCLLKARCALIGEGVAKTKTVIRYTYNERLSFYCVWRNGKREKTTFDEIKNLMISADQDNLAYCEVGIPSPCLEKIDVVDTPGFNASQKDTERTTEFIDKLDFIFFIIGTHHGDFDDAERRVLAEVTKNKKLFSVLYNCCNTLCWNPSSDNVRRNAASLESYFRDNGIIINSLNDDFSILPVNLGWYWTAILTNRLTDTLSLFDMTNAEKTLLHDCESYFYRQVKEGNTFFQNEVVINNEQYVLPLPSELEILSNIDKVRIFINAIVPFITPLPVPKLNCSWNEGKKNLDVSWSIEDDVYNYIFELQYREQNSSEWKLIETDGTQKTFSGLRSGMVYEFRVRSKLKSQGRYSEPSEIKSIRIPRVGVIILDPDDQDGF